LIPATLAASIAKLALPAPQTLLARLILAAPSTLVDYLVNPRRSEYSVESCCSIDPGCWIDLAARLVLAALVAQLV